MIENLADKVYNDLTVKEFSKKVGDRSYWLCECRCGSMKVVRSDKLKSGWTKSCGCLKEKQDKLNLGKIKHGFARRGKIAPECNVWNHMLRRCNDVNDPRYSDYGARGIKVCERWLKFESFIADMGSRPSSKHTIERKDNNGDYCPENCIWATRFVQSRNKRNNIHISIGEETKILKDWAIEFNLSYKQIHAEFRKSPDAIIKKLKELYYAER